MDDDEQREHPPHEDGREHSGDVSLAEAVPGLVRIAAGAWWRTTGWTVQTSLRAGSRLLQAAASGESAAELLSETSTELRDQARRVLGVAEGEPPVRDGAASAGANRSRQPRPGSLRDRGAELLRQSADIRYEEDAHPAYARILGELAPDEGRILRLLRLKGPQAAVDVRAGKALNIGSELVAAGLSMIGAQAGCRYLDRVPAYLNNVYRLGLIWFSREPLSDPLRYQVLEAQPDVIEALRGAGRRRTVRRSIHLTPFGEDFCRVCLPLETAELDALPGTAAGANGATAIPTDPTPRPPKAAEPPAS